MKERSPALYSDYLMDCIKESGWSDRPPEPTFSSAMPDFDEDVLSGLECIGDMSAIHTARSYLEKRCIPAPRMDDLYYTPDFFGFTNKIIPGKFEDVTPSPYIVIPLRTADSKLFGYQGRALIDVANALRYITISLDKSLPRVYGLDRVGPGGDVYAFEGPFDSMFVPNGIASAGGKITSEVSQLGIDKHRIVVCYDNEPRNKDVVRNISHAIDYGFRVFIWGAIDNVKDVNDLVLCWPHASPAEHQKMILTMLQSRTYSGLKARLEFDSWKKWGNR